MTNQSALSVSQKESIYRGKLNGRSLSELAAEVGCSKACARKWWRVGRDKGLAGLRTPRQGRSQSGILSQFDERIAEKALSLKRSHPRWGARRVLVELQASSELSGLSLPGISRLAALFKARCPECVAVYKSRPAPARTLPKATAAHEVWQLDSQEGIRLNNGDIATICNIRDPVGAAMIASRVFVVQTQHHWRKLTWTEVRGVLRKAFTEWQTLPDELRTDNELGLAGGPNDPFPGRLTLWLVGLGIAHRFIRPGCPTDQPQIERNHRTLNGFALHEPAIADPKQLQMALDRERNMYNHHFPAQASDCAGRPPLIAHPELLQPRRAYKPDLELALFDIQRVYQYLAQFTFLRRVNASAQVSLGRRMYSLGKKLVRERQLTTVYVRFDPHQNVWLFLTDNEELLVCRKPKELDVYDFTELDEETLKLTHPVQLTLPFLVP